MDFLWVLKKKYNELRQLVKHKARATVRGDQEARVDTQMGLPPAETTSNDVCADATAQRTSWFTDA